MQVGVAARLFVVIGTAACASASGVGSTAACDSTAVPIDYQVLAVVMKYMENNPIDPGRCPGSWIVHRESLNTRAMHAPFIRKAKQRGVLGNLACRNATSLTLDGWVASDRFDFLTRDELRRQFENSEADDPWRLFFGRFPEACGTLTFSLPGYHRDSAAVVVLWQAGVFRAEGILVRLQQGNDASWKVVDTRVSWAQ